MSKKQLVTAVGGMVSGFGLGYLGSLMAKRSAEAAVSVRPALAETGFVDALLANHSTDWLWYNYPAIMTAVMVVVIGVAGFIGGFWINE